jgi:AAA15 family ATPase/GTPase
MIVKAHNTSHITHREKLRQTIVSQHQQYQCKTTWNTTSIQHHTKKTPHIVYSYQDKKSENSHVRNQQIEKYTKLLGSSSHFMQDYIPKMKNQLKGHGPTMCGFVNY